MTLEGGEDVKEEGERKSEENDLAKSRDESSLKKRALWFFAAIIIGIFDDTSPNVGNTRICRH